MKVSSKEFSDIIKQRLDLGYIMDEHSYIQGDSANERTQCLLCSGPIDTIAEGLYVTAITWRPPDEYCSHNAMTCIRCASQQALSLKVKAAKKN